MLSIIFGGRSILLTMSPATSRLKGCLGSCSRTLFIRTRPRRGYWAGLPDMVVFFVIARAVKQAVAISGVTFRDCFVASLLAMTERNKLLLMTELNEPLLMTGRNGVGRRWCIRYTGWLFIGIRVTGSIGFISPSRNRLQGGRIFLLVSPMR